MIIFLALYLIFLIIFVILSYFAIYHARRFGFVGDATKVAVDIYLIVSAIIIISSFVLILGCDWSGSLKDIFNLPF